MRIFRRRRERELVQEIETHLSLAEDEYRKAGMSDAEARDAARRALGGVLKTRQAWRDEFGRRWLDALQQDVRFGLRGLARDRAFALTAILVLGLGIGVNNMQFTIIYTHTVRSLPIDDARRVLLASFIDDRGIDRSLSYAEYQDLRAGEGLLSDLAAFGGQGSVALGDTGRAPDRHLGIYTTANAFDVLRIRPQIGRVFSAAEEQPGAAPVVMLGADAWRARYGADPSILGREVLIDGRPATVIGVLPEESGFPSTAEVLMPVAQAPAFSPDRRDARFVRAFGRVLDDASVEEAAAQLTARAAQAARMSGESARSLRPRVTPITTPFRGRASDPAWMAFFAVGFLVVAVACFNAANLMLARGVQRTHEIAIRGSLGASRRRIVTQLLVESVVLAAFGAVAGLAVSLAGVRLFQSGIPANAMPYWFRYSMDAGVFTALVVVSFGTVLIFGLVPALQTSKADVARVLKDGGRSGARRIRNRWLTASFMVAQLGLSCVLMSYVVIDLFERETLPASDEIIATPEILTATVSLPAERYSTPQHRSDFVRLLQDRLRAMPGVAGAALTNILPRNGATEQRLQRDPADAADQLPPVWTVLVSGDYFATLRLPLLRGRESESTDVDGASTPAIVNERFVALYSPERDVMGRQMRILPADRQDADATSITVVGVAPDIRHRGGQPDPVVYLPLSTATPRVVSFLVRSGVDPATMTQQLRDAVFALDTNLPVFQVATLERVVHEAGWNARASSRLVTALSTIVLLLSSVGLYAVTAHRVSQRSKEIGIRVAVGARPAEIRRLVLRGAALQVVLGLLFGVLCTIAWDSAFFSGRVDVRFADPKVLGPIAAVLALVTVAACLVPARRAARLDPVTTLRQD